jgi:hypothetical protein
VNGWIVGYIIGGAVVVVVVLTLLALIAYARRTAEKAEEIAAQLRVARDRSDALSEIDTTVRTVARITTASSMARMALVEGRRP